MNKKFIQFLGIAKKAGKLIQGYNKSEEAIKRNGVDLVIISNSISENTRNKFKTKCVRFNIPLIEYNVEEGINEFLGTENIKILAIKDKNMANKLLQMFEENK